VHVGWTKACARARRAPSSQRSASSWRPSDRACGAQPGRQLRDRQLRIGRLRESRGPKSSLLRAVAAGLGALCKQQHAHFCSLHCESVQMGVRAAYAEHLYRHRAAIGAAASAFASSATFDLGHSSLTPNSVMNCTWPSSSSASQGDHGVLASGSGLAAMSSNRSACKKATPT